MPDGDPVVADTSPLLNLALVDRLDLLDAQFETIHVPEQVWKMLGVTSSSRIGVALTLVSTRSSVTPPECRRGLRRDYSP